MDKLVSLKGVCKSFGAHQVLRGVDLEVGAGELVAIIGRSGSGKSTALRCMDLLERVDAGEVRVCGHQLHEPGVDKQALRRDVGIVFQGYNLFPHLTVRENIALAPKTVKRLRAAEVADLTTDVLRKVGLLDKIDFYPEQLSGGQQQRVAIARSLAMHPKVMLFDEVTSALDPALTAEVLRVMEQLATDGMTMILVTHEMSFARAVADRVIFMEQGRVWEQGPATILDAPSTTELKQFLGSGL